MSQITQTQVSFSAGEWSPRLFGRNDLAAYFNASSSLVNFIPQPHGGIERRPGTRFVAEVKHSDKITRLLPFQFNNEQSYQLEYGDLYVRFYRDRSVLLDGGSPYEITSQYGENDLPMLKFTQSADILYLVHPNHRPRELRRMGDVDWEVADFEYDDGPYLKVNTNKLHKVRATTAPASYAITVVDQPTHTFTVAGDQTANIKTNDLIRVIGSTGNDGLYHVLSAVFGAATVITVSEDIPDATVDGNIRPPTVLSATADTWSAADQYPSYRFIRQQVASTWGVARVVEYTNAKSVRAIITENFGSTDYSSVWRLGAWGDRDIDHPVESASWPQTVMFHQSRIWFGGSYEQPQTLWSSVVGDFTNFQPSAANGTVADDDAVTVTLDADQVNTIYWLMSGARGLAIGTDGGEWIMNGGGPFEPIVPTVAPIALRQTNYGSRDGPRPAFVGPAVFYVTPTGRKLRILTFDFDVDQFDSVDMTERAEHITTGIIKDIVYQREPDSMIWAITDAGDLLSLTFLQKQEVIAWARQPIAGTDAAVKSISAIKDNGIEEVWLIVSRTIDGATVQYVEFIEDRFAADADQEDAFFVDSGLTYDGAPATVISGLDHLEGETVKVYADGATRSDAVVSGGSITIDPEASVVQVGLGYSSTYTSMPIEPQRSPMDPRAKHKGLYKAYMRFYRTLGGKVGVTLDDEDPTDLEELVFRHFPQAPVNPTPMSTGIYEHTIGSGHGRSITLTLSVDTPTPSNCLSIIYGVDQGGE